MAISDTISSIEDNIRADYEGLENIGADLTGINKNILNIRTILDTIYNDLPKVTGEGEEVTLTPTRKGKLGIVEKGNSTQESTNGYNLVNYDNTQVTLIKSTSRTITITPTNFPITLQAGTYTLSVPDLSLSNSNYGLGINMVLQPSGSTQVGFIPADTKKISFTINEETTYKGLYFYMHSSDNDNATATFSKIQLESGSTAHEWEQYTGGIPAPNPSYPFPIKSVTGNNNVVVNSRNWFNSELLLNAQDWVKNGDVYTGTVGALNALYGINTLGFPIKFKENTQYRIGFDAYVSASNINFRFRFYFTDGTYKEQSPLVNNTDSFSSFNVVSTANKTVSKVVITFSNSGILFIKNISLYEYPQSDYTYVPYQNQTLPLNLGTIELNKIGNYQDYIYKTSGKNLFDRANATENTGLKWADGLTYTGASTTGMIISDYINITNIEKLTSNYTFCIFFYDSNKTYLGNGVQVKKESYGATYTSITIPYSVAPNIYYARIEFRPNENNSEDMTTKNLMVNLGSTALPYEPYGSGIWYKHEIIRKAVLNGTEDWRYQTGTPNFFFLAKGTYDQQNGGVCMSNQYQAKPVASGNNTMVLGNAYFVLIRDDRYTDKDSYKTWLSSNTLIVYYQLATPTDIQITDTTLISQLEEIDKIQGYEGTTIITSTFDNNNSQMIISASALKGE